MAHNEFAVEMTPLVGEPRLRGASESSTRTMEPIEREHTHHASLWLRSSIRPHRSPFLQAELQKFVAH